MEWYTVFLKDIHKFTMEQIFIGIECGTLLFCSVQHYFAGRDKQVSFENVMSV